MSNQGPHKKGQEGATPRVADGSRKRKGRVIRGHEPRNKEGSLKKQRGDCRGPALQTRRG